MILISQNDIDITESYWYHRMILISQNHIDITESYWYPRIILISLSFHDLSFTIGTLRAAMKLKLCGIKDTCLSKVLPAPRPCKLQITMVYEWITFRKKLENTSYVHERGSPEVSGAENKTPGRKTRPEFKFDVHFISNIDFYMFFFWGGPLSFGPQCR